MNENEFYEAISQIGIVVSDEMKQQFLLYKNLIQEVNQVLNLTGIDDDEGIFLKHFYDSLLIAPLIDKEARVCDVGSGAGFPGLVLAIARPDIQMVCIEPTTKRTNFLDRVVSECGLKNVLVLNERAEDIIEDYRESFDVATARAVAYLDILSELCLPFVKVGGRFLAMKGSRGVEEFDEAEKAVKLLGGQLTKAHEFNDDAMGIRYNLEILKIKKTHKKYPRTYAKIKKTPLSREEA